MNDLAIKRIVRTGVSYYPKGTIVESVEEVGDYEAVRAVGSPTLRIVHKDDLEEIGEPTSYTFKTSSSLAIDWQEIASHVSKENPLVTVKVDPISAPIEKTPPSLHVFIYPQLLNMAVSKLPEGDEEENYFLGSLEVLARYETCVLCQVSLRDFPVLVEELQYFLNAPWPSNDEVIVSVESIKL